MRVPLLPRLLLAAAAALLLANGPCHVGTTGSTATPDVDDDGVVDAADQAAVAACLGTADVDVAPACAPADVDGDGDVDADDEALVLASLGARVRIEGELRRAGGPVRAPFAVVGGLPSGHFAWSAALPTADVRDAPGALSWTTDAGSLTASPVASLPRRRVDPATGRPLAPDAAPGATCATGAEPACWQPGDAAPGDLGSFEAVCRSTIGLYTQEPGRCTLDLFGNSLPSDPISPLAPSLALALTNVMAGQHSGSFLGINHGAWLFEILAPVSGETVNGLNAFSDVQRYVSPFIPSFGLSGFGPDTPTPLVPLVPDADDGTAATLTPAELAEPGLANWVENGLQPFLTASQEALLGCGPFWQTRCDPEGIDVARSEPGALLAGLIDPGEEACTRPVAGVPQRLPGCRGPADAGYAAEEDGSTGGAAHPFSGAPFAREIEILAHDFAQLWASQSLEWHPAAVSGGGCTLEDPAACNTLVDLLSMVSYAAPGDPAAATAVRWIWAEGATYEVTSASGELAPYLGWTLHVLGPERARVPGGGGTGVGFLLSPPAGSGDVAAPFVVRSLGPDLHLGTADDVTQGVAYGVAD